MGHDCLLALVAWGCREAARASAAYAVAKTLVKEGLGCLSHTASGTTRRQRTFWKGELTGKMLLLALESITVLMPVIIKVKKHMRL